MINKFSIDLSSINKRRLNNFKKNKRGFYSFIIFLFLFITSLFGNFIANERPLIVYFDKKIYFPILVDFPETEFDGEFDEDEIRLYRLKFLSEVAN